MLIEARSFRAGRSGVAVAALHDVAGATSGMVQQLAVPARFVVDPHRLWGRVRSSCSDTPLAWSPGSRWARNAGRNREDRADSAASRASSAAASTSQTRATRSTSARRSASTVAQPLPSTQRLIPALTTRHLHGSRNQRRPTEARPRPSASTSSEVKDVVVYAPDQRQLLSMLSVSLRLPALVRELLPEQRAAQPATDDGADGPCACCSPASPAAPVTATGPMIVVR